MGLQRVPGGAAAMPRCAEVCPLSAHVSPSAAAAMPADAAASAGNAAATPSSSAAIATRYCREPRCRSSHAAPPLQRVRTNARAMPLERPARLRIAAVSPIAGEASLRRAAVMPAGAAVGRVVGDSELGAHTLLPARTSHWHIQPLTSAPIRRFYAGGTTRRADERHTRCKSPP